MTPMEFLESPLLEGVPGLLHGFGRRFPGPREGAKAAAREAFAGRGEVFFLRQVHGCTVVSPPWTDAPNADASLTSEPGSILAIETADCLPVLVVDPVARRVAAAHAGWRGTAKGVAARSVEALLAAGSRAEDLIAALGPSNGPCCYEVGRDVEEAFGPDGARFFVAGRAVRQHLDVAGANRAQLQEAGVRADRIETLKLCTQCRPDLFFSYRRDGAQAGRMISVIGFARPA